MFKMLQTLILFSPDPPCSPPIWQRSWSEWSTDGAAQTDTGRRETAASPPLFFYSSLFYVRHKASVTYQVIVVDNHQLDVLGLGLDGALASPHLRERGGGKGNPHDHAFESAVKITFTRGQTHTNKPSR